MRAFSFPRSLGLAPAVHDVLNTYLVATLKSCAVIATLIVRHVGMSILIPVIHIRLTMVLVVLAGTLDTIVKPSAHGLVIKLAWRVLPVAMGIVARRRWALRILRVKTSSRTQHENRESRCRQIFQDHNFVPF